MNTLPVQVHGSVYIDNSVQDWQIFQQTNGFADLAISGSWQCSKADGTECVYVRLLDENTHSIIIPYTAAETKTTRSTPDTAQGKWQVKLSGIPAGGLYLLESCLMNRECTSLEWSHRGDMRHHLGIGDLYVIAGQSNAVGFGRDPVPDSPELGVHVLRHSGRWSLASHPFGDSTDSAASHLMERINPGHSPFLSFGKLIKQKTGMPVGLLPLAKGSSSLSEWSPRQEGHLYQSMLETIQDIGGRIRGLLWSQGCSDAGSEEAASTYGSRFQEMVAHLRQDLADDSLPVFILQINRYIDELAEKQSKGWSLVREEQRQLPAKLSNVYLLPTIDAQLSDPIHNASSTNVVIGARLANLALYHIYGHPVACHAPDLAEARISASQRVTLMFCHVNGELSARRASVQQLPFQISDGLGNCSIESVEFSGDSIDIRLSRKTQGSVFVSCLAGQNPAGAIPFDTQTGLPLIPFFQHQCLSEISLANSR